MSARDTARTARTWLFVPGDRPERFPKAAAAGADIILLDLEDAVLPAHKDAARDSVTSWLAGTSVTCAVRVNAVGTAWHAADLAALATGGQPRIVVLPKSEDPEGVARVVDALPDGSVVVALVETAQGVTVATGIARVAGVARLVLGTYDLAAELGVDPDHAPAMASARGTLVLASAAGGLPGPVDGVTGDVHDPDRVTADVLASAALGFAGKLCVHPAQVVPATEALAPSAEDIAWAGRVVAVGNGSGEGVALVDGRMVDRPVVERARRILATTTRTPGGNR